MLIMLSFTPLPGLNYCKKLVISNFILSFNPETELIPRTILHAECWKEKTW